MSLAKTEASLNPVTGLPVSSAKTRYPHQKKECPGPHRNRRHACHAPFPGGYSHRAKRGDEPCLALYRALSSVM